MRLGGARAIVEDFLVPIGVAILAYVAVDRLGEWKRRRSVSLLAVIVFDSLLEELRWGLRTMETLAAAVDDPAAQFPAVGLLPQASWTGMSTISDDVMLRIIAVTKKLSFAGFHPRELRSHCKNYFAHMTVNYEKRVTTGRALAERGQAWRESVDRMLRTGEQPYIEATRKIIQSLEEARSLLDKNARRWIPA